MLMQQRWMILIQPILAYPERQKAKHFCETFATTVLVNLNKYFV